MDLDALLQQLDDAGDDGSTVEAKRAKGGLPREIGRTLSAFANTRGGYVLLGVTQERGVFTVTGVDDPGQQQRQLSDLCKRMQPPIRADIDVVRHDRGAVVMAWVPPVDRRRRPCHLPRKPPHGHSYVRSADENLSMTDEEVTFLLLVREDHDPTAEGCGRSVALDPATTARMVERERRRSPTAAELGDDAVADRLQLHGADGTPTTAAALLAAPAAVSAALGGRVVVDLGRRRVGGKRQGENVEGPLHEVLVGVMAIVREAVGTEEVVDPGGAVREEPQINTLVLREVVANALLHRSYTPPARARPVHVDVLPGLVRITSPGPFVADLDPSMLGLRRGSRPRNPHLMFLAERTTTPDGANLAEYRSGGLPDADRISREERRVPPVVAERPDAVVISLVRRRLLEAGDARSNLLVAAAARLEELDLEMDSSLAARLLGVPSPDEARVAIDRLVREGRLVQHRSPAAPHWTAATVHGRGTVVAPATQGRGAGLVLEVTNLDRVLAALSPTAGTAGWMTRATLQETTGLGRETLLTAIRDGIERGAIQARGAANSPKRDYRMHPDWRGEALAED